MSRCQESHHEVHRVCLHVPSILQNISVLGNNWREVVHLPFPFVLSSWAFSVKFFWIIVGTVIEVINGEVLVVLHPLTQLIKMIWPSQLQDCLEDVLELLLKFLLGFGVGVLLGSTHWCFGNVGRGAHVEVVKGLIQSW